MQIKLLDEFTDSNQHLYLGKPRKRTEKNSEGCRNGEIFTSSWSCETLSIRLLSKPTWLDRAAKIRHSNPVVLDCRARDLSWSLELLQWRGQMNGERAGRVRCVNPVEISIYFPELPSGYWLIQVREAVKPASESLRPSSARYPTGR